MLSHLSNPLKILLAGGAVYGCGVVYMTNNYYRNSALREIFVKSDRAYEDVKVGHHP